MNSYLFEITARVRREQLIHDEFGWVEGYAPGNGKMQMTEHNVMVVAPDEHMARAWVFDHFSLCQATEIISVKTRTINAIVVEVRS